MNQQFAASAAVIALGWIIRRRLVDEAAARAVVLLIFNVTLPGLVIQTFDGARLEPGLALLPAVAIVQGVLMPLVGATLWRRRSLRERGQLTFPLVAANIGMFAYPLVEAALGRQALRPLAMFDVGTAFTSFGIGTAVAAHHSREGATFDVRGAALSLARTVPFVVYLLALAMALAGLRFPEPVRDVAAIVGRANMPLSLLVLGMYLHFEPSPGHARDIVEVLATRIGVGLALGIPAYLWLPVSLDARKVVLAALLCPPPLLCLSHATRFGYDARFAGLLLNVGNVAAYATLWILFNLLS